MVVICWRHWQRRMCRSSTTTPSTPPASSRYRSARDDPVAAADHVILTRETVRAVSRRHGLRASFAPVPVADKVGNGMHLHMSMLDGDGRNLFADGNGPSGLTSRGESALADLLARLPALAAIGAPSVSSHLRSDTAALGRPLSMLGSREPRSGAPVHPRRGRHGTERRER